MDPLPIFNHIGTHGYITNVSCQCRWWLCHKSSKWTKLFAHQLLWLTKQYCCTLPLPWSNLWNVINACVHCLQQSIQKHNTMLIWYSKTIELQNAKTTWENTNVLIKKMFLKQVLKISFQNYNLKIKTNNVQNTFTIYPTKNPLNLPLTISHV